MTPSIRHWLLQLLWPFKAPNLKLTEAARLQMARQMRDIHAFAPAATVMWGADDANKNGRWVVAFYDVHARPSGRVLKINGIPFIFVQEQSSKLNGATLDYREGRFVVEGAID